MSARATFLDILRGPEGRRLRPVVAAILALAGFFGGFNAAQAAASDGLLVLCKTDDNGAPSGPADKGHSDCCLSGHNPSSGALPPAFFHQSVSFFSSSAIAVAHADRIVVPLTHASEGPRGPPLAG